MIGPKYIMLNDQFNSVTLLRTYESICLYKSPYKARYKKARPARGPIHKSPKIPGLTHHYSIAGLSYKTRIVRISQSQIT